MSNKHQYTPISVIDGVPTFAAHFESYVETFEAELLSVKMGQIMVTEIMTEAKALSVRQIRWWKGVLLPALSAQTGNTVLWWENRLKTQVMPDDFQPTVYTINGKDHATIPSISSLSMKKMNLLTEGTVAHLHDRTISGGQVDKPIYGDMFTWVTLPNPELRKTN